MEKIIGMVAGILVIVGALNWGLIGAFDFNLVETIFGIGTMITKVIYILVGVSAIVTIWWCRKCNYMCESK